MTQRNNEPEVISRSNDLFFNYFHAGHRHIVCLPKDCLINQLKSGPSPLEREQTFRQYWPTLRPLVDAKLDAGEAGLVYLDADEIATLLVTPMSDTTATGPQKANPFESPA